VVRPRTRLSQSSSASASRRAIGQAPGTDTTGTVISNWTPGEEGLPQRTHVCHGRVDTAVAASTHREMKGVRAQTVCCEVADGRPGRQLVAPQKRGVVHRSGPADALIDELVERHAGRALGEKRENDVAAVAVRERRAGLELLRVPAQHDEVVLRGGERVYRDGQDVVRDLAGSVLVQVVADPRAMGEEMLDRDVVADEREIFPENGASAGGEVERAGLDQAHDGQRRQALRTACYAEPRVDGVRDSAAAMSKAVRALDDDVTAPIHADDAREEGLGRE
jgi:hypothetical protein